MRELKMKRGGAGKKVALGFDLGSKNMAYGRVIDLKGKVLVKKCSMFQNPIKELKDSAGNELSTRVKAFVNEFEEVLNLCKPDVVMAERFMTRGFKGSTIEAIGLMLGLMAGACHARGIKFILVTASTWKNSFSRRFGGKEVLPDIYKQLAKKQAHKIDACLIGCFCLDKTFERVGALKKIVNRLADVTL